MARPRRRPRGHIEQRPNGSFRAVVYAGVDPLTGKPRYLRETTASHAEAEKALTRLQHQVDQKRHPRTSITVDQAVAQWLEVARHEPSTRERYEDLIRLYITPTIGSLALGKLDAELLERLYARLCTCRHLCSGPRRGHTCAPLAPNTVRKVHFVLRATLDRAVRWRYVGTNEAALAEPPAFQRSEPDPPSPAEAAALLTEAWRDPDWGLLLWLTMLTGSRRGEICGLRWSDLDLDRGLVSIEFSYSRTRTGAGLKRTKTRQKRRIALDAHTVDLLRAHLDRARRTATTLGFTLPDDAFVFPAGPDGSDALLPATVSQRYRRLARRVGLRSTRLHALRHYSATELIAAGVDLRTVAGRLGHGSGGGTTLRIYAAWVTEADKRAADTIADILPRPDTARRTPRSPYEHLAAELRGRIERGELAPGDQLPTITDLATQHGVSVGTAHRALALLRTEGLIHTTRGRRTTVATTPPTG